MVRKLNFSISGKAFYTFLAVVAVVILASGAYAALSGTSPNPGHFASDLEVCDVSGEILKSDGSSWTCATDDTGSGGDSLWTAKNGDIYYDGGNVGIGTSSPVAPLHLDGFYGGTTGKDGVLLYGEDQGGHAGIEITESRTDTAGLPHIDFHNDEVNDYDIRLILGDADDDGEGVLRVLGGPDSEWKSTLNVQDLHVRGDINVEGNIYKNEVLFEPTRHIADGYFKDNIPKGMSRDPLLRGGAYSYNFAVTRSGSITGLSALKEGNINTGSITINVQKYDPSTGEYNLISGPEITFIDEGDSNEVKSFRFFEGEYTFNRNDVLRLVYTSSSDLDPSESVHISSASLEVSLEDIDHSDTLLVNSVHTVSDCYLYGGTPYTSGSYTFCKFGESSCPGGWSQYLSWCATSSNTCTGETSCTTGDHDFSDASVEFCEYLDEGGAEDVCFAGQPTTGCY